MVRELALEPRGWNEVFRAPGLLSDEACHLDELSSRKWFGEFADREQVLSLASGLQLF